MDISGDTRLKIGSNRRRKPPAFNSFLGNSTLSVSRISANDTFDKLVGDERYVYIVILTLHTFVSFPN